MLDVGVGDQGRRDYACPRSVGALLCWGPRAPVHRDARLEQALVRVLGGTPLVARRGRLVRPARAARGRKRSALSRRARTSDYETEMRSCSVDPGESDDESDGSADAGSGAAASSADGDGARALA